MAGVKIKIKPSELRKKSREELLKIKKQCEFHISQARLKKNIGRGMVGFKIKEEKKNIARINTILNKKAENLN